MCWNHDPIKRSKAILEGIVFGIGGDEIGLGSCGWVLLEILRVELGKGLKDLSKISMEIFLGLIIINRLRVREIPHWLVVYKPWWNLIET